MIQSCKGCAHLKQLQDEVFDCTKARCVLLVKDKTPKRKMPEPDLRPWAKLVLTPEQAGWKKHKGDMVRYLGDDPDMAGKLFRQRRDDVVVLGGQKYIYLDKVPGELVPMRHCE